MAPVGCRFLTQIISGEAASLTCQSFVYIWQIKKDTNVADFSSGAQVRFLFRIFLLFCFCSNQAAGQYANLQFRHITPEDGLSQGVVTSILKDSHGFVWMTTYDGINRFDGVQVLSNDDIAPGLGIISNTAVIIEDSHGNIWFGSIEGLIKFDYQQNRFFTYSRDTNSNSDTNITKESYYPIAERQGMILYGTISFPRCYIFDTAKEIFIPFLVHPMEDTAVIEPVEIPREATLFADVFSFSWYDDKKGSCISWMEQRSDSSWQWATGYLPGVSGTAHTSKRTGDTIDLLYWNDSISGGGEKVKYSILHTYNFKKRLVTGSFKADYNITWLHRWKDKLYLSSEESGLHVIDEKTGMETERIVSQPGVTDGLRSNSINIFTITGNELWVSSWGAGVDYAYLGGTLFTSHFSAKEAEIHGTSNFVRGIVEDDQGHFWCNVQMRGIVELNERLEYIRTLPGTENINGSAIFIDKKQVLYFGNKGMWSYDIPLHTLDRVLGGQENNTPFDNGADYHYFSPDQTGDILATSMWGIHQIDRDKNILRSVSSTSQEFVEIQQFAYVDRRDQLYAYSGRYGLNVLRRGLSDFEGVFSFSETFIPRHAYEQNDSILWLGTTAGLLQFNTKALKIIQWFRTGDGLPNNTVYAIAPDGQGRLWLSTNKGLCSFDLKTKNIIQFTDYPGQQGREYNRHAVCVARDGRILFGGVNGITAVHPTFFNREITKPVIQFTSINHDEGINPFGHDQLSTTKFVKAGTSLMEFQFLAIDYNNSKLCRLKYKMDGVDEDWKETENPSSARYLNLKPGRYAFRVLASDANGVWSEQGQSFLF